MDEPSFVPLVVANPPSGTPERFNGGPSPLAVELLSPGTRGSKALRNRRGSRSSKALESKGQASEMAALGGKDI